MSLLKKRKPRILLLVDYRGWAYDHSAQELSKELTDFYDFEIRYVNESPKPQLRANRYDLIYVFFWGEKYHLNFGFEPSRTIKAVSSHRWEDDHRFGPCKPSEMVDKYLKDAQTVICTSKRLLQTVAPYHPRVFHTPNGVNIDMFRHKNERVGPIKIGWAGNSDDPVKGLNDILRPICKPNFELAIASGGLSHDEMNDFYNQIDVLAIASKHEGEPLTLIEAMAAGCFPVSTDVGIVPELIQHRINGYIVSERTTSEFKRAFNWCAANEELVRQAGKENAVVVSNQRDWKVCAQFFKRVFEDTLAYASQRLS